MVLLNSPMLSRTFAEFFRGDHAGGSGYRLVGLAGGLLHALAGAGAHVQADQAGVHAREEIAAQNQDDAAPRARQNRRNRDHEGPGVIEARAQRADGSRSRMRSKPCAKPRCDREKDIVAGGMFLAVVALEKVHGHGRHQGSRKQIRGQHGEDHGFGQGHEQKLRRRR